MNVFSVREVWIVNIKCNLIHNCRYEDVALQLLDTFYLYFCVLSYLWQIGRFRSYIEYHTSWKCKFWKIFFMSKKSCCVNDFVFHSTEYLPTIEPKYARKCTDNNWGKVDCRLRSIFNGQLKNTKLFKLF